MHKRFQVILGNLINKLIKFIKNVNYKKAKQDKKWGVIWSL
jgi:hypothetical protein